MEEDLVNRFNQWYIYQIKNLDFYNKHNETFNGIMNTIGKYDAMYDKNRKYLEGNYIFYNDDITILIVPDRNPESEINYYTGYVYYTNDENNTMKVKLQIDFNSDGWYYSDTNHNVHYFGKTGYINTKYNHWYLSNMAALKAQENELRERQKGKETRRGTKYGGRKSRKSRKSRKNKKQKNRKTNRR